MQSIYRTALGVVLCTVFTLSPAQAETTNYTAITSLPYVIYTQGVYCFTGNLSTNMTSNVAIAINANNVTIDMNGYKLGGLAAGDGTTARGIGSYQRKNITIRNGVVRGFLVGIDLSDDSPFVASQGHVVTGILADQNTYVGIRVAGRGMTVRRNQVVDTGGSTVTNSGSGIAVYGHGNNIFDNQVSTTTSMSTNDAYGIILVNADNSMLKDNRLSETVALGSATSHGIHITNSNDVIARNNLISLADSGIYYLNSAGLYGGNYTSNVTTPFSGGTAAGGSNYTNP